LNFLGFGHSHIVALAMGAYALQAEGYCVAGAPVSGRFHYLYDADFEPAFHDVDGRVTLNSKLGEILASDDHRFVVVCLGGNEHNVLSVAEVEPKYDFIPSRDCEAVIDPDAWFIPEAVIRETLRGWMSPSITLLSLLTEATRRPVIAVAPPPPLPRERVLAFPREFFRSAVDSRKVSDDRIRRKMWLSQISLIDDLRRERNFAFVETPADVFDRNGMLAPEFWGKDASHGNEAYGRRMMLDALDRAATILASGT
jgi:hypothetical protein